MPSWRERRSTLDICVFGSFAGTNQDVLEGLIEHLQSRGYTQAGHVDLTDSEGEPILGETPQEEDRIYTESTREAYQTDVAFFVMFPGEQSINQSVLLELQARVLLRPREANRPVTAHNTLVLPHEEVDRRSLLRGLLRQSEPGKVPVDEWEDPEDLCRTASGFLLRR